jgi:hypothetical protein
MRKTLQIAAVLILSNFAFGQDLSQTIKDQADLNHAACPNAHSIKDTRECGKTMRQWCKDNGVKARFGDPNTCTTAWVANLNAQAQAAQNQDQASLDQAAMASYAQFGKPTGLSFTEWETVEVHAWKADTETKLGFADWLKTHLH